MNLDIEALLDMNGRPFNPNVAMFQLSVLVSDEI